jgi:Protein of unknown function (DUF2971)
LNNSCCTWNESRGYMSLKEIVASLYGERPQGVLYHYTSLDGMLNIVRGKLLRATEVRYFNDAAELRHAADMVEIVVGHEITLGRLSNDPASKRLFYQFRNWLHERFSHGPHMFVACFTAQGNLLSQWRGYCPPGKGVSLGFPADVLPECAASQVPGFSFGKCVYDRDRQLDLVKAIVYRVVELARARGENLDPQRRNPENSFHDVFAEVEADILRIAVLLKHPAFSEEEEWRAVSSAIYNYVDTPIEYREGTSTLVPFIPFNLPTSDSGTLSLDYVYVGPTPRMNNSISAASTFLSKAGASPRFGVHNCEIPYRTW